MNFMDFDEQRILGVKLAKAAGANKTLSAVKNQDACFHDIMRTAAEEVGLDAFVSQVLQGPPEWANAALLYVPNLGSHRDALVQKADEVPKPTNVVHMLTARENAASASLVPTDISAISLADNASCTVQMTVNWIDNGSVQPTALQPDWNGWLWGGKLTQGKNSGPMQINSFQSITLKNGQKGTAPLSKGDAVWIVVWVMGQAWTLDSRNSWNFNYDPQTKACANFSIAGPVDSTTLTLIGVSGGAAVSMAA